MSVICYVENFLKEKDATYLGVRFRYIFVYTPPTVVIDVCILVENFLFSCLGVPVLNSLEENVNLHWFITKRLVLDRATTYRSSLERNKHFRTLLGGYKWS